MPFHHGITRGRWPTSITTLTWPGVCFGVILGVLAPWLTVMAADEEGFVVPPDGAMRAAGPVGRERDIAEILATRERTKGAFGILGRKQQRYVKFHSLLEDTVISISYNMTGFCNACTK